ncbi:MAG: tetratricopeptide repeat protein [Bacteroidales bacterium]|nr:tetratricopeptide repeat protein [Bacteroidales bacterium]
MKTDLKIKIYLFLVVPLLVSCSTQKNTFITRTYHNITSKYNVFFNGTESFKKGQRTILDNHKNDYSELLPVFLYEDEQLTGTIGPDMDRTIKKTEKLISLHSITVKPEIKSNKPLTDKKREFLSKKEYNSYVDNSYLLMGKAQFYKHEFEKAKETFLYIINEYQSQKTIYETKIWLARTYNEQKNFESAYEILNLLENTDDFPKVLMNLLYTTIADYYIKNAEPEEAIPYIEKSLKQEKKKKLRIRYTFILAQLFERTGKLKKASDHYNKVIKMNPPYEMTFNARISRALAYEKGFGSAKEIEGQLLKMLKDDKNIDYRDQIFFALGNLAMKEDNINKAIENYRKSIRESTSNTEQKTKSYLTLADIYYELPDYILAQAYYDSTVTLLDMSFPEYDLIYAKSQNLTDLVEQINIVNLEDSVQRLAEMDRDELLHFVDDLIAEVRRQEEQASVIEQERMMNEQFGRQLSSQNPMRSTNPALGGKWYFYNETAKSLGFKEFKLRWGNRKLEDNWRRKNRISGTISLISSPEQNEPAPDEGIRPTEKLSNKSRDYYLKDVPLNDSMMQESHNRIEQALFLMGQIYMNDLKDPERAAESFKEMIKRYPGSVKVLQAYYNLYTIYKQQGNAALTEMYKRKIIAEYPKSSYAQILTNPNYIKELEDEEHKVEDYYAETYHQYLQNNFAEVISRCDYALNNYPDDQLIPKFSFLRTLCIGKTRDIHTFSDGLYEIVSAYPGTEVAENAKNILYYIERERPQVKEEEEMRIALKLYEESDDTTHFFVYVLPKGLNINQLIFNIINFNLDYFDDLNLRVESMELNSSHTLVLVKSFEDRKQVMPYYDKVTKEDAVFKDVNPENINGFVISGSNMQILQTDKSVDRYLKFFGENYH